MTYRNEFTAAGLACTTYAALIPALIGYSFYPLAMWLGGTAVWLAMRERTK